MSLSGLAAWLPPGQHEGPARADAAVVPTRPREQNDVDVETLFGVVTKLQTDASATATADPARHVAARRAHDEGAQSDAAERLARAREGANPFADLASWAEHLLAPFAQGSARFGDGERIATAWLAQASRLAADVLDQANPPVDPARRRSA